MKVDLRDVIEAIEFENELLSHYYNKKTGVIIYKEDKSTASLSADNMSNIDDYEEWQQELIKELYDLEKNPDDYIKLPDINELDEKKFMMMFMDKNSIKYNKEDEVKDLKRIVEDKCSLSEWYDFRENIEMEIAVKWCENNNIEY